MRTSKQRSSTATSAFSGNGRIQMLQGTVLRWRQKNAVPRFSFLLSLQQAACRMCRRTYQTMFRFVDHCACKFNGTQPICLLELADAVSGIIASAGADLSHRIVCLARAVSGMRLISQQIFEAGNSSALIHLKDTSLSSAYQRDSNATLSRSDSLWVGIFVCQRIADEIVSNVTGSYANFLLNH